MFACVFSTCFECMAIVNILLKTDTLGWEFPPPPKQEFDNYAEWDLRDIDFVEDDSDILHGNNKCLFLLIANYVMVLCWGLGI